MLDGIDIYDIAGARLIKTIAYDLAELYMMDIRFLDEERLVSGYSRGTLVITSCSRATSIDPIMIEGVNMDRQYTIIVIFSRLTNMPYKLYKQLYVPIPRFQKQISDALFRL